MQTVSRLIQNFTPKNYSLSIEMNRLERTFLGTVVVSGESHLDNSLRLHAKDLVIESAHIDGHEATWSNHENDEVEFFTDNTPAGNHVITIGFSGKITDSMHGLYPCYFEHKGEKKELLATQLESHHAREVFPCVDEPEAKATFDVTLTTEKDIVVLGNMPVKSQKEENNKLVTSFEQTPRMSSYLLAWVAGEMHEKSAKTESGVEVNIWATPAQKPESLDFALDIATRTIDFFDKYFDTPYPLPKCDHVALPDFSSGAMENWGLITYREVALVADPKTSSVTSRRYVATVIAHELSHQWFGNLVTMKWWNNLWLNESFANFMEYIAVDALHPEWNIWLEYSTQEVLMALRRDALAGVQAVQTDVHHPDEISTLFDGAIVYAKGGRLLRMLQHYIGEKAFQTGLKNYFKKYAYQNTEGDDLWRELGDASGKDIAEFMNTWISQSGYPVVSVSDTGLVQEQFFVGSGDKSDKLWPIPLSSTDPNMPDLMKDKSLEITLARGERLNTNNAAHFITHYSAEYMKEIVSEIRSGKLSPLDRLQLLNEQSMLARGMVISSAELVPLLRVYADEDTENVWDIIAVALNELKKFIETDDAAEANLRKLSRLVSEKQFLRLGWGKKPDESESDTKLRATILGMTLYGEQPEVLKSANDIFDKHSIEDLEPEIRALIIGNKVRHFGSAKLVDDLIEIYKSTPSAELRDDICSALTSTKHSEIAMQLLSHMKNQEVIRAQDVFRWFAYLIRNRYTRELSWQWMKDNWSWIDETFSGDKSYDYFPQYSASGLVNSDQLNDYRKFFEPKKNIPALKRVIDLGIKDIESRVNLIKNDGQNVINALAEV